MLSAGVASNPSGFVSLRLNESHALFSSTEGLVWIVEIVVGFAWGAEVLCMDIDFLIDGGVDFIGIEVHTCMGMEEVQDGFLYELVVEVLLGGGIKIVVCSGACEGLCGSVLSSSGKRSVSGGFGGCVVVDRSA